MNNRGWTFIDDNEEHIDYDSVKPKADALAKRWSELHDQEERSRFALYDDESRERLDDYLSQLEEDEYITYTANKEVDDMLAQRALEAQYSYIEEELAKLGCRMMRAYEHWNEDEKYMQYMEEGRFGHWSK